MLLEIAAYFCVLSIFSVGGLPSVMPEMQRYVVEVKAWMSPAEFMQAFAVGQAAPGPNMLIVSLVGWHLAGLAGALVALFAFYADFAAGNPALRAVVTGVGAAGAGMFIGTAIKLGRPIAGNPAALAIIAACFLCIAVGRLSLVIVLPVALGLSLLLARRGWL